MHGHTTLAPLGAERRQAILGVLARDGKVLAARSCDELGVSEDTMRRDSREPAAQGLLRRARGGALPPAPQAGDSVQRSELRSEAKAALACVAVTVLGDARVLFLDGSTTSLELAWQLPAEPPRAILTNFPPAAAALAGHPSADVDVIGGRLDKRAHAATGTTAVDLVRSIRADTCVIGICALHPDVGLSADDLEEAQVKRAMADSSADAIALVTTDNCAPRVRTSSHPSQNSRAWWPSDRRPTSCSIPTAPSASG